MSLFQIPDPVSIYESAKTSGLERQAADAFVSALYSAEISFLWRLGSKNWFGLGQACQDMATAQYLTLSKSETKGFLKLTVPTDMLEADNLSKFQTEWKV
jgi:hypothetical protein